MKYLKITRFLPFFVFCLLAACGGGGGSSSGSKSPVVGEEDPAPTLPVVTLTKSTTYHCEEIVTNSEVIINSLKLNGFSETNCGNQFSEDLLIAKCDYNENPSEIDSSINYYIDDGRDINDQLTGIQNACAKTITSYEETYYKNDGYGQCIQAVSINTTGAETLEDNSYHKGKCYSCDTSNPSTCQLDSYIAKCSVVSPYNYVDDVTTILSDPLYTYENGELDSCEVTSLGGNFTEIFLNSYKEPLTSVPGYTAAYSNYAYYSSFPARLFAIGSDEQSTQFIRDLAGEATVSVVGDFEDEETYYLVLKYQFEEYTAYKKLNMSSGFITNISGLFSSAVCEITRQNSLFIWSQHATLSCSYHDQGSSVSKVVNLKAGSSINTPHSIAIQMNVKAIVDHNGDVLGFYARDEDVEIDTSGNYQLNVFYPVSGQSKAINYPGKTSSSELNFSYMSSSTTEYDKSIIAVSSVGRVYSFTLQNLNQAETAVEITEDVVLSAFVENDYFLYLNDSVLGDVLLTGNNANVYNSVGASYGYRNIDLEYHAIGDYFVKYNANFPPELNTLDVHNKSNGAFVKNQVLDETGLCMFRKRSVGNMLVYSCDALESINIIDAQTLTDDVITNIDLESSAVVFLTSHMERPSAEAEVKLMVYEYSSSLDSTAVYELVGRSLNLVMTFDTPVNYLWAASLTRNGVVNMVSSMMFTDDPFATYSYGLIDGGDISYR